MNNHYRGIEPSNFAADRRLALFDVLSTNKDRQNRPFVSTIESSQNLYAVQWHPEKNAFENGLSTDGTAFEGINHGPEASRRRSLWLSPSWAGRARRAIILWSGTRGASRTAWRSERTGRTSSGRTTCRSLGMGGRRLVLISSSCLVFVCVASTAWTHGFASTGAHTFETGFLDGIRVLSRPCGLRRTAR